MVTKAAATSERLVALMNQWPTLPPEPINAQAVLERRHQHRPAVSILSGTCQGWDVDDGTTFGTIRCDQARSG